MQAVSCRRTIRRSHGIAAACKSAPAPGEATARPAATRRPAANRGCARGRRVNDRAPINRCRTGAGRHIRAVPAAGIEAGAQPMRGGIMGLGEEGTEQFTVTTRVNDKLIAEREIHDPFATTCVTLKGLGHAWRALFGGIRVQVSIGGSHGAMRAIMTMNPRDLQQDHETFLIEQAQQRAQNSAAGIVGYCSN
jgi:hypothetical protein